MGSTSDTMSINAKLNVISIISLIIQSSRLINNEEACIQFYILIF